MRCSSVIHVVTKKPSPKKQKGPKTQITKTAKPKKRKLARGKEQRVGDIIIEVLTLEYVDIKENNAIENNKPVAKGTTTAHFVKFMNELLDIMNMNESLMGSYLVMNNCATHKSHIQ
ncbi:hypothetical protein G6F46_003461 [Rhizopus delemar]|uniref:Tc1-like transposase DDE domain-containing protein n=2 Tax=Rhizopus TaxID=4842 RepID=A0A9P6ZAX3_9FUNG|nr:hypothetical protein G6F55_002331 [Rhizopus delemar]KAG1548459.1 hypothetical protein G6F51_003649 [Rhizopus arrhizus]KAG1501613.1 hypothetical protein G6F54_002916 [Rhizopus delemar]KAG1515198.1 hypothetical protein G6F53_003093 [Rhizopus delemar]KAG1528562.1 hypothetical protein G6F52_000534 [Rhizopus delemar]